MGFTIKRDLDGIDWHELESLFIRASLKGRQAGKLKHAYAQSSLVIFVLDQSALIATARAITDFTYHAVIYDVAVDPAYQGQGLGREMMSTLLGELPVWRVMLICDDDVAGFYEKLGFAPLAGAKARFDWQRLYEYGESSEGGNQR